MFDDTLDKLHEHIQAAMGWTNSHLHHFFVEGRRSGDPEFIDDDFEPFTGLESTRTLISELLPADRAPISCEYDYDSVTVGCMILISKARHSRCLVWHILNARMGSEPARPKTSAELEGTQSILRRLPIRAISDIRKCWIGTVRSTRTQSKPRRATHVMQEGIPDWRRMVCLW